MEGTVLLRISRIASLSVFLTGGVVLAGWAFDIPFLKGISPGWASMKANTATGFMLLGASLFLLSVPPERVFARRLGQIFAAAAALVGLLTISEYVFGWDLGIDQLLFRDVIVAPGTSSPGRMAPLTALNFALLGAAAVLVSVEAGISAACGFTFLVALNAGLASLGYLYGIESFYTIAPYSQMALHTAVAFLASAAALFLICQPERAASLLTNPGPAGVMIRRLLPAAFAIQMPFSYWSFFSSTVTRTKAICDPSGAICGSAIHTNLNRSFSVIGRLS